MKKRRSEKLIKEILAIVRHSATRQTCFNGQAYADSLNRPQEYLLRRPPGELRKRSVQEFPEGRHFAPHACVDALGGRCDARAWTWYRGHLRTQVLGLDCPAHRSAAGADELHGPAAGRFVEALQLPAQPVELLRAGEPVHGDPGAGSQSGGGTGLRPFAGPTS